MAVQSTKRLNIPEEIRAFFNDESGATFLEYTLIVALISLAMLTFFGTTADSLSGTISSVASDIDPSAF